MSAPLKPAVAAMAIASPIPRVFENSTQPLSVTMINDPQGLVVNNLILSNETADAMPAFAAMRTAMQISIIPKLQANIAEFNLTIVPKRNRDVIVSYLKPHWLGARDNAMQFAEQLEVNQAKHEAVPAATDATMDQGWRDEFRPLPKSEKLRALIEWPIAAVFAIARLGREAFGLTNDDWQFALNRIRAHNLSNADAVRTSFTRKPTLNDPIARGADETKIAEYVEEALKTWAKRRETVNQARIELQQVVLFVANVCEMKPEEAFNMLAGIEADNA